MKKLFFLALLSSYIFVFNGCKSKSDLLVGEWSMEWTFVNGARDAESDTLTLLLEDDGDFRQVLVSPSYKEELKGTWSFDKEVNAISLYYTTTGTRIIWFIKEFEENYMELKYTTPGFLVERRFIRKN